MGQFYFAVYTLADNRLVLLDESPVFPVLPDYWPWYEESTQGYLVGMDEDSISDEYWGSDGELTDDAIAELGVLESERGKYHRGLVMVAEDETVPISHHVIAPATGVITLTPPALSAQRMSLEVGFIPGDLSVDLTGGPNGEAITAAVATVSIRVRKLYSDGTLNATATDALTLIPSRSGDGIKTASLVAGVHDFTFALPSEAGWVTVEARSALANTSAGSVTFYRDAPP